MADALIELEALREATRVRLSKAARRALGDWAEVFHGSDDRLAANGLQVLLDMHDKLEAIRHGS